MIKFSHRGTDYVFDELRMNAAEAMAVKKHTGLGMLNLMQGVAAGDPDAIVALVMVAQLRAGELKHTDVAGPDNAKTWQALVDSFDDEHDLMAFVGSFQFLTEAQLAEVEKFAAELKKSDPAEAAKPAKRATK